MIGPFVALICSLAVIGLGLHTIVSENAPVAGAVTMLIGAGLLAAALTALWAKTRP